MIKINGKEYPTVSDLLLINADKRKGKNYVDSKGGIFFVRRSTIRTTSNGNEFSQVLVCDSKKSVDAKIWDRVEKNVVMFADYEYSPSYRSFSLTPKKIIRAEEAPEVVAELIPHFENLEELERCLLYMVRSVKNEFLRGLLEEIFVKDEDFYALFVNSTAASRNHHVGRGGLLFHTVSVAKIGLDLVANYPQLNRDLVLTGCLLHDIGKVESYDDGPSFDYTNEGKLENHIVLGIKMLVRFIDRVEGFPKKMEGMLMHVIASHHGSLEYGSPVIPKTPEAMAVHFADEVDAKLRAALDTLEDVGVNSWSEWQGLLRTELFKSDL